MQVSDRMSVFYCQQLKYVLKYGGEGMIIYSKLISYVSTLLARKHRNNHTRLLVVCHANVKGCLSMVPVLGNTTAWTGDMQHYIVGHICLSLIIL